MRAIKTCSVTWAGTAGMSMTSRVRCAQPPANPAPHSGQESRACSTRRVGVMRWRDKPWRRGLFGPLDWAGFRSALGLRPGIPMGPPGLAFPSRVSIRCCNLAMIASRTSREAVLRSSSRSMD